MNNKLINKIKKSKEVIIKKGSITLVILNYNRERFIDRAIRSCLDQKSSNRLINVMVIDDASTDNSLDKIHYYIENINFFSFKKNKGIGYLSNYSLKKAKTDYWMRVDSDDFIANSAVESMCSILDNNKNYDLVYGDHYRIDDLGMKINKVELKSFKLLKNHGAGVLFRKKILNKIGGFDPSLREYEDANVLEKIFKIKANAFYLPVPLYRYHIHGENISITGNRKKYQKLSIKNITK